MSDEMKACPLCDERPVGPTFVGNDDGGYVYVECPNNGRSDGHFCGVHADTNEAALAAWNTRAATTVKGAGLVERLRKEVQVYNGRGTFRPQRVNPDGPEAADTITTLKGEIERRTLSDEAVNELAVRITEHAVMELDADEENSEQINAFGAAIERELRQALGSTDNVG